MENYAKSKIYFDGSHYIAIPPQEQPWKKRKVKKDMLHGKKKENEKVKDEKQRSKEMFNEIYKENADKKRSEKVKVMEEKFKDKFKSEEELKEFVKTNMERTLRRTKLMRKVNLQEWNYFCTFTYDDKKCDERTFRLSFVLVELKRNPHFKQGKKIVKDMKQKDYNTIFF